MIQKINHLKNNLIIKNTLILIGTSLLIKILSLVNRIVLTRLLGNDGISLYVLVLPTIMLLMSMGGFSLHVTISKIVSENERNKEYSYKTILKSSVKMALLSSIITIIIFINFIRYISFNLLKQPASFYPLLISIIIIPFVALNNCYRGFYNGLNNVKFSSRANLIEQVSRLILSFLLLYIFKDFGIVANVTISIIAMAFGEIISLLYIVTKVNNFIKDEIITFSKHKKLDKKIYRLSMSQTLSHLIANVSFFLEPIIYTYALGKIFISSNETLYHYSEVNAYALPLLQMFFFTSASIATVIIPTISKNQGTDEAKKISTIALRLSLIPSIFLGVTLFYFSKEFMLLLYSTTIGAKFTHDFSLIFIFFYLQPVLIGILQATGNQNKLLLVSICDSILKLILIIVFTNIKTINYSSLIYSVIVTNVFATIVLFLLAKRVLKFNVSLLNIFKLLVLFVLTFFTFYILINLNLPIYLIIISSLLLYLIYLYLLKLDNFKT